MNDFIARRTPTLSKKRAVMDYGYRTGQGGDEDAAVFELPNEDIPTARSAVLYLDHAAFEAMGSPEVITVTIEPGDLLNDGDAWPFKPGDVVSDIEGAETEWLEAAPQRTVVVDSQGTEWVRLGGGWFLADKPLRSAHWASPNLQQTYGPLSVVSVGTEE